MRTTLSILITLLLFSSAAQTQQDENIIWSKFQYPIQELFTGPDTNFIYANQWDLWRFVKIDANTGDIIDSVYNKGMICGLSKNGDFIFTRLGHLESIKKLDIMNYQEVDSIDNLQDCKDGNPIFGKEMARVMGMKLTSDERLIVHLMDGKYAFIILDANNLEIKSKKLCSEISDSLLSIMDIAISNRNDYFICHQFYYWLDSTNMQFKSNVEVHVWDLKTIKPIGKILYYGPMSKFYIFTFSPDGEYVFIRDSVLHIYETGNFNLIKTMDATRCIDFTEDGKTFLINLDPVMQYWNLFDFNQICIQPTHSTLTMKLSLDNKHLYKYNVAIHNLIKAESCLLTDINEDPIVSTGKIKIHQELNSLIIEGLETETIILPLSYTIIDIKGNIIQQGAADYDGAHIRIDISNLINGVHFVKIGEKVLKFIKI